MLHVRSTEAVTLARRRLTFSQLPSVSLVVQDVPLVVRKEAATLALTPPPSRRQTLASSAETSVPPAPSVEDATPAMSLEDS